MTSLICKVVLFGAILAAVIQVTSITVPNLNRRQSPSSPAASIAPVQAPSGAPAQPWNNPGQFHLSKNFSINATPTTRHYNWTISQQTIAPDGLERSMLLVNGKEEYAGPFSLLISARS